MFSAPNIPYIVNSKFNGELWGTISQMLVLNAVRNSEEQFFIPSKEKILRYSEENH